MVAKLRDSDSYFVQVDIQFAKENGLNEAIVAGKLLRLQDKLPGATDAAGVKWVRLTLAEWVKELPFMGEMTIRRTIESLKKKTILLVTTFHGQNRSKWYRINPEFLDENASVQNEQMPPKSEASVQNEQIASVQNEQMASVQNEQLPIILRSYINKVVVVEEDLATRHNDFARVCEAYQYEIGGLSQTVSDALNDDLKIYPAGWVIEAMKLAAMANARNLNYVEAILKNWQAAGGPQNDKSKGQKNATRQRGDKRGSIRALEQTGEALANEPTVDIYTHELVYPDGRREPYMS